MTSTDATTNTQHPTPSKGNAEAVQAAARALLAATGRYRTPELGEPDNEARASWAEAAVQVYAAITRHGATFRADPVDEAEEILSDFNADLRHLARRCDIEPDVIEDRGRDHFEAEEAEEADEDTAD